jgi:hypothetical protein
MFKRGNLLDDLNKPPDENSENPNKNPEAQSFADKFFKNMNSAGEDLVDKLGKLMSSKPQSVQEAWDEFRDNGLDIDGPEFDKLTVGQMRLVMAEFRKSFYAGSISANSSLGLAIQMSKGMPPDEAAEYVQGVFQGLSREVREYAEMEMLRHVPENMKDEVKAAAAQALEQLKMFAKSKMKLDTEAQVKAKAKSSIMQDFQTIQGWPKKEPQTTTLKDTEIREYDIPLQVDLETFAMLVLDVIDKPEDREMLSQGTIPEHHEKSMRESFARTLKLTSFSETKYQGSNVIGVEQKKTENGSAEDLHVMYLRGENNPWIEFSFSKLLDDIMANLAVVFKRLIQKELQNEAQNERGNEPKQDPDLGM